MRNFFVLQRMCNKVLSLKKCTNFCDLHSTYQCHFVSTTNFLFKTSFKKSLKIHRRNIYDVKKQWDVKNKSTRLYGFGFVLIVGGLTYMSVLLYRLYCQVSGLGGKAVVEEMGDRVARMKPIKSRNIKVRFNADVNSRMAWNFEPQQQQIIVSPGETALAFYTAMNPTNKPIIGIATYNVLPFEAGKYFNKIQCFCFEEQMLNPNEEVDMPVLFFLDPEYAEDPKLETVNDIILSYTFFEVRDGLNLPVPSYA